MKKKKPQKISKQIFSWPLILAVSLLVGITVGVVAIFSWDLLTSTTSQTSSITTDLQPQAVPVEKDKENVLPGNFPPDFPIYPDSQLKNSYTAQGQIKEGISVLWESEDSLSVLANFYKTELPKKGWSINSSFQSENSYTISFAKNGAEGFLGITQGEGGRSQISATVGIEIITI